MTHISLVKCITIKPSILLHFYRFLKIFFNSNKIILDKFHCVIYNSIISNREKHKQSQNQMKKTPSKIKARFTFSILKFFPFSLLTYHTICTLTIE